MDRTQIYLHERETTALDRVAAETGRTRSDLIREAIAAAYAGSTVISPNSSLQAFALSAGAWKQRRASGEAYVEALRKGRRLAEMNMRPSR